MPTDPHAILGRLEPWRMRFGLERVAAALDALGHPERAFASIHVAGTNGKGSTCAFVDAVLRAKGLRTGLYTSPHLSRFNERIAVQGSPVSDADLGRAMEEVLSRVPRAIEGEEALTYFEFATVLAFVHFARVRVDIAVLETGLGGRLDATNVVVPVAAAVTRIGLDHTAVLGTTPAAIAHEKAGIFKPGVPAVIGPQAPEAAEALASCARSAGSRVFVAGEDWLASRDPSGAFRYTGRSLAVEGATLSLLGAHQVENAGVACAVLDVLPARFGLGPDQVRAGLSSAAWPGRLERRGRFVLDGAHNPDGAAALRRALDDLFAGQRRLVFGVLADKDAPGMARILFPGARFVHLVAPRSDRALDPAALAAVAREMGVAARVEPGVREALAEAAAQAKNDEETIVVCGSLYLVGETRDLLDGPGSDQGPDLKPAA